MAGLSTVEQGAATSTRPVLVLLAEWCAGLDGGAKIRSMQMLRAMAAERPVRVLCFDEGLAQVRTESFELDGRRVEVTRVPKRIRIRRRPLGLMSAFARGWIQGQPYVVAKFHSPTFARLLRDLVATIRPAWIHCGHLALLPFVPRPGPPIVFDVADVVHEVWRDYARTRTWPLAGWVRHESRRLERHECQAWAESADAVVTISEHDAARVAEISSRPVTVIPPIASPAVDFLAPAPQRVAVGMIGNWTWPPNRNGLDRLLEELLPLAREQGIDATWIVAGRGIRPSLRRRLASAGVSTLGHVADPMEFYGSVGVVLAPYTVGCGVRLKVLDALAAGCALVATPMALRGLPVGIQRAVGARVEATDLVEDLRGLVAKFEERARRALAGKHALYRWHDIAQTRRLYGDVLCRIGLDGA